MSHWGLTDDDFQVALHRGEEAFVIVIKQLKYRDCKKDIFLSNYSSGSFKAKTGITATGVSTFNLRKLLCWI